MTLKLAPTLINIQSTRSKCVINLVGSKYHHNFIHDERIVLIGGVTSGGQPAFSYSVIGAIEGLKRYKYRDREKIFLNRIAGMQSDTKFDGYFLSDRFIDKTDDARFDIIFKPMSDDLFPKIIDDKLINHINANKNTHDIVIIYGVDNESFRWYYNNMISYISEITGISIVDVRATEITTIKKHLPTGNAIGTLLSEPILNDDILTYRMELTRKIGEKTDVIVLNVETLFY